MENKSNNDRIYGQREILGIDEYSVIHKFVRVVLISENMLKFKFNENWNKAEKKYRENVSGFIKTIVKFQLVYFVKEQYSKGLAELTHARNADGLSGVDKMEMQQEKVDEGSVIISEAAAEFEIDRLMKDYEIEISDEELDYYMKNFNIHPIHQQLIVCVFASALGSYRNALGLSRINFIKLALILKKRILRDAGFDDPHTFTTKVWLPYILTGNVKERINTRLIRNARFREDCEESYVMNDLFTNKYKYLEEIDPDSIMTVLSTVANTVFTYCCYEQPDMLGVEIEADTVGIADELAFYLRSI